MKIATYKICRLSTAIIVLPLAFLFTLAGCKKFLDEKPLQSLAIPTTVAAYQALLDKYSSINNIDASSGEVSAGETYLTDADYDTRAEEDQRMYTWQNDHIFVAQNNDWYICYSPQFTANTVIEGLKNVDKNLQNEKEWNSCLGQAYFIRARKLLQAADIWCKAYDENTAAVDLGVVIRTGINFNDRSVRSNLRESYGHILADLKRAVTLLPNQELHVMRSSKPAAYALLARTYLWMRNYEQAGLYADSCLKIKSTLMDLNALSKTATYPFTQFNTEVIYSAIFKTLPALITSKAKIIDVLYNQYEANDLRKTLYFKDNKDGTYNFKGSFDGSVNAFSGIATDEVYLTRAECYARQNKLSVALADLNTLLATRFVQGSYVTYTTSDQQTLINKILAERRKELLIRGVRWMDIKRYNKEGAGISLTRTVKGRAYTLPANSPRFELPIPEDLLLLSDIVQNSY